jgi:RNA polymerase sigma-70 factor, ECF subfamily
MAVHARAASGACRPRLVSATLDRPVAAVRAWAHRLRWVVATSFGPRDDSSADESPSQSQSTTAIPAAFDDLFARHYAPLVDYLFGMTRDRELAADLTQDTFLRAYTYSSERPLVGISHPRAWLYRIATNVALNANRHRRHFEWLPLSRIEPEAGQDHTHEWSTASLADLSYEDVAATVVERDAVWSVLAELPPRWRAVLLLQTTGGFSVAEIATLLRLSEANVRKMLFRAKERFRAIHAQMSAKGGQA